MITKFIRATIDLMLNSILLTDTPNSVMNGEAVLVNTYAKAYYRGKGWWAISGYAADGSDVHRVIVQINDLKDHRAVRKEGGQYFNKKGEACGLDISKWVAINKAIQRSPLTGGKRVKVNIEQREYHCPI